MQDRDIARSITEIFLASKIIKAVENVVARKESALLIDNDNISLEDYLFNSYENNYVNKPIFKNIMFVDSQGRVLNISGSLFVTEAETMELANGTIVRTPTVNMESTNEVASSFISMPSSVDITGTISNVKDITIEKVGNAYNVINTQTQEIIATVKTTIVPALKDFAASVIGTVKGIFGSIVNDPLPYVIGLLGGVIVFPVLKKVISLFGNRGQISQNNQNINEENYNIDEFNVVVFEEEDNNKLRKLFDRILVILKTVYKKAATFIKAVVGFMVGIFRKAKDVAQRSLVTIKRIYVVSSYKFTQYILYVVEIIVKYAKLAVMKVKNTGKIVYSKVEKRMREIAKALNNTLQNAVQKIRNQFRRNESDKDLQEYLDAIIVDLERLQINLKIVFSKDFGSDEGKKALSEIAKTSEDTFKHIFSLLVAFLTKLKNKAKEIVQKLIDKTVRVLQVIGDVIDSFIKALGEFAKRIKAKVSEWINKIRNAISANPIYQKLAQQLSDIKERIR